MYIYNIILLTKQIYNSKHKANLTFGLAVINGSQGSWGRDAAAPLLPRPTSKPDLNDAPDVRICHHSAGAFIAAEPGCPTFFFGSFNVTTADRAGIMKHPEKSRCCRRKRRRKGTDTENRIPHTLLWIHLFVWMLDSIDCICCWSWREWMNIFVLFWFCF